VEDPIEYLFPWMVQTQVNERDGVTFARSVRAILRSDPDVIMIGELRNGEAVHLAEASALTGHLVMTTLHADEAAGALVRMVEMGSPPFVAADATKLIISQRLVRVLCRDCSRRETPSPEHLDRAEKLARSGGLDWDAIAKDFRKPVGCGKCRNLGYRGRTVIAEMLEVTPEIGAALRRGASVDQLRTIAVGQGMTTMAADGVRRAATGLTSLHEVMRVLGAE